MLSWLPFKMPSLWGREKDAIPSWISSDFEHIPEMAVKIARTSKFRIFKSKKPTVGEVSSLQSKRTRSVGTDSEFMCWGCRCN